MSRPFSACNYIEINNKKYIYLNDDNPQAAYFQKDIAFVAQPIQGKTTNIITVPLMMTDDWEIISEDENIINELRSIKKNHSFNFIGQSGYADREVFRNLDLQDYLFRETKPVYGLPKDEKLKTLKNFLKEIATAKFVFSPRGIGSSSFRAYQSMMVGSIPIITGMNDYPFSDQVDWDSICIRGNLSEINNLINKAQNMTDLEYTNMRLNAINFWDNYCKHDVLYKKLKELV